MNENTENEKLPYPKMDIDCLRSKTHHRGSAITTATLS